MLAEVPIQCLQGFLLLAAGKQLSYEDLRAEARTLGSPGELLRFFSPQKDGKIIELNGRIYHLPCLIIRRYIRDVFCQNGAFGVQNRWTVTMVSCSMSRLHILSCKTQLLGSPSFIREYENNYRSKQFPPFSSHKMMKSHWIEGLILAVSQESVGII